MKKTLISFVSAVLTLSILLSCTAEKSGSTTTESSSEDTTQSTTTSKGEQTKPDTDSDEPQKPSKPDRVQVHPAAAPKEVPDFIKNYTDYEEIKENDTCPERFSPELDSYFGAYSGSYTDTGRVHLSSDKLDNKSVTLLFKELDIVSSKSSAFYISTKDVEANIYLSGKNSLSSPSSVTFNNKSTMNESNMDFNECSDVRIIGVNGKDSDYLSLVSDCPRSSLGGKLIVNNCTLDLSKAVLTEYGNILIERGGCVIFPDGSTVSLSDKLPYGVYFYCDYASGECVVYCTDESALIDFEISYSSGEHVKLSGKSGEMVLKMPKAGMALAMDGDFCSLTCLSGESEIAPISKDGALEFHLPGGYDLSQLRLKLYVGEGCKAIIAGREYSERAIIKIDVSQTKQINVTFVLKSGVTQSFKYTFACSDVSVLYLDINESMGTIRDMHRDSEHETPCFGTMQYVGADAGDSFKTAFAIKGRGNATWSDEKKGYNIKLYDSVEYSKKNKIDISGMGRSANWTLLSCHRDRTLIRTALVFTLAQRLKMESTINYVFTELYMNGDYLGLYMLTQKVEANESQTNIEEASADNLTGGYILEFDNYDDSPQIVLKKSRMKVTVKEPDDIHSYSAIEKLLNDTETALMNDRGYNSQTKKYWYDYIDIESFAKLWILREYSMDFDATVNFRFYYDPSDGKFHGGPGWDFDNSMARTAGKYADPYQALIETGDRNRNCWLTLLMRYSKFTDKIVELYNDNRELFDSDSENSIYALALDYYDSLAVSIERNFNVWERQLYNQSWNTPADMSYDGHFEILTEFLLGRNEFWEEYIPRLK